MESFTAEVLIIGINPYVGLPENVLNALFEQADKSKSPIPVRGTLNGKRFVQTLVKYQGAWRLYSNSKSETELWRLGSNFQTCFHEKE